MCVRVCVLGVFFVYSPIHTVELEQNNGDKRT